MPGEMKQLGKIESAEFGLMPDRPMFYGLYYTFSLDGGSSAVGSNTEIVNCEMIGPRIEGGLLDQMREISKVLKDAKVHYISELVGKPVEVTLEGFSFKPGLFTSVFGT